MCNPIHNIVIQYSWSLQREEDCSRVRVESEVSAEPKSWSVKSCVTRVQVADCSARRWKSPASKWVWIIKWVSQWARGLPMALDTDRLPFTLHVPNQITQPPRASILCFSSCRQTHSTVAISHRTNSNHMMKSRRRKMMMAVMVANGAWYTKNTQINAYVCTQDSDRPIIGPGWLSEPIFRILK